MSPLRPGAKNPTSFWVEDDHWYDFGSASGGDVIDLAAQLECDGDVGAAVRKLASELGLRAEYQQTWKKDIQQLCNRAAFYPLVNSTRFLYGSSVRIDPSLMERST